MFKILRVFIGTVAGFWIASYFLPGFDIHGWLTYVWGALMVMAAVFVARGFSV